MNPKTAPKFQDMFITMECYRKPNGSMVLVDYVCKERLSFSFENKHQAHKKLDLA